MAPSEHAPSAPVAGTQRSLGIVDSLLAEVDRGLQTVFGVVTAQRPYPGASEPDSVTGSADRREVASLMRVNHAGEVAAQALYHGQAFAARDERIRAAMFAAAREETDHLAWCATRIEELGGRTSLMNPLWYAGSFAIGAVAGFAGDRESLGFVAETERQVVAHLEDHLARLPQADLRTRRIVEQMRIDEARHGASATAAGGRQLPTLVRRLMQLTAKFMTRTASRI
jgi:3-demethoxyubiquinol 3-hydroxylase